ncbi:MAG: flagellar protein FlgN [Calditrichaeota bacterium]|nr:flagellar protein FlgN [Calditrichota bacterium]
MRENHEPMFKDLVEIITKELVLYESLLTILKDKQNAIISGNIKNLRENIREETNIVQEVLTITAKRDNYVGILNQILDISDQKPKLKTIIERSPSDYSVKLSNLRYQLKNNLNQITITNKENKYLLNSSIEQVRGMVNLFLSAENEPEEIYDVNGFMTARGAGNNVLNCQI